MENGRAGIDFLDVNGDRLFDSDFDGVVFVFAVLNPEALRLGNY